MNRCQGLELIKKTIHHVKISHVFISYLLQVVPVDYKCGNLQYILKWHVKGRRGVVKNFIIYNKHFIGNQILKFYLKTIVFYMFLKRFISLTIQNIKFIIMTTYEINRINGKTLESIQKCQLWTKCMVLLQISKFKQTAININD